jgi:glycosyltransferase involved in cell wall biosynthesis
MIIGIDGNEANVETKVGISEYAFQLLKQFSRLETPASFRIYLKNHPNHDFPETNKNWKYRVVKPHKLWTQVGLPVDLYRYFPRPNVFFTPSHYAPRFSPVPTVISIMDTSYIYFPSLFKKPDLYQLQNWTKYSAKNAKKILTISESSKRDIMRIYDIPQDRIVVTYPGLKKTYSGVMPTMDVLEKTYHITGKYILFVGTLQPRKNIEKLIEAFAKVVKKHSDVTLVVVGKHGWMFEDILKAPKKWGIEEQVKFVSFVPDEDLASFYKHAVGYVLPSLYEGFGLPVLEAMSYDCPVITSNISSLPEAGGDAALYIDPQNANDIAEKITQLLTTPSLRDELIEKGRKQVKKFSWEKTAKETLAVLESVATNT